MTTVWILIDENDSEEAHVFSTRENARTYFLRRVIAPYFDDDPVHNEWNIDNPDDDEMWTLLDLVRWNMTEWPVDPE